MRSGGGGFLPVDAQPKKRSSKWKYKIARIPCENQSIRFFAENPAGRVYSQFTMDIPASTPEEIKKAAYEPSSPGSVSGRRTKDKVIVSWEKSKCAQDYNVDFSCSVSELGELPEIKHITSITSIQPNYELSLTADQRKCTEWEVAVTAFIDDSYSEPAIIHVSYSDDSDYSSDDDNSDDDNSDDYNSDDYNSDDYSSDDYSSDDDNSDDYKADEEHDEDEDEVGGWKVLGVLALGLVLLA